MKKHALWPALSRWIVALVFIFSGFVKGVDPWGTAIKLGEYLRAFSMDWLVGAQFALSILLSATEMTIGLCLLFRVRERGAARLALLFMGLLHGADARSRAVESGRGLRLLRRCGEADQLADVLQEYSLVGFRVAALAGRSP